MKYAIILFLASFNVYAFDADYYLNGGINLQLNGSICDTVVVQEQTPAGDPVEHKYSTGYVGFGEVGGYVNPFAAIYMKTGYSYMGCTGQGQVIQGFDLGLQVGRRAYISADIVLDKNSDQNPADGRSAYAYHGKIGALVSDTFSVDFRVTKDTYKVLTYLVGFNIHL